MKSSLVRGFTAGALIFAPALAGLGQTVIADWTMPTAITATTVSAGPVIQADVGQGTLSGFHTAAARWVTPTGNGDSLGYRANTWTTVGDYFQFDFSTTGYSSIEISFDQLSVNTGAPTSFKLAYSVDGTSYTDFANYSVLLGDGGAVVFSDQTTGSNWNTSKVAVNTSQAFDLSSVSALSDQTSVSIRLISTVASPDSNGASILDNLVVTGTAVASVPEPSTLGLLAMFVLVTGAATVRLRLRRSDSTYARK